MSRHRTFAAWLLTSLLGTAAPLRADVKPGEAAPEMEGDVWFNAGKFRGKKLSDFRRSAIFLEFWQTW